MKQLTIAAVFLPLTFITGCLGQKLGWLTGHIQDWGAFVGLALGIELLALALLFGFFKRLPLVLASTAGADERLSASQWPLHRYGGAADALVEPTLGLERVTDGRATGDEIHGRDRSVVRFEAG